MNQSPSFAVFGCGAIGAAIAGYTSRAGQEVLMIEPWEEHARKMQRDGLLVTAPNEEWNQQVRVITPDQLDTLSAPLDIVVLSTKSMETKMATELLKPYLSPDGCIISAQNSINEDQIAPIVGANRTVGCVVLISSELPAPGHVRRKSLSLERDGTSLLLGELNGEITDRLHLLQGLLEGFGPIGLTTNLLGARWGKLTRNSMHNSLQAVTGMDGKEVLMDPITRRIHNTIGFEMARVADAHHIPIEHLGEIELEDLRAGAAGNEEILDRKMAERGERMRSGSRSSTAQDALRGRPLETDYFNGYIARKAHDAGISAPMNERMVEVARQFDAKTLPARRENAALFESCFAALGAELR
jgi:2-dehydropantoate 2-reductase